MLSLRKTVCHSLMRQLPERLRRCWPQNQESLQCIVRHNIPAPGETLQILAPESGTVQKHCVSQYSSFQRRSADVGSIIRNRSKALCFTVFQLSEKVCGCWLQNQEPFKNTAFHSISDFREGLQMVAPETRTVQNIVFHSTLNI